MDHFFFYDDDNPEIPVTRDLAADGVLAKAQGQPILLLVSREDCSYCYLIKREILRPMVISGEYDERVLIREMMIDYGDQIVDFNGVKRQSSSFAREYGVDLTPTLLFLAPDGEELVERIIGVRTIEMLAYYIDASIDKAGNFLRLR